MDRVEKEEGAKNVRFRFIECEHTSFDYLYKLVPEQDRADFIESWVRVMSPAYHKIFDHITDYHWSIEHGPDY